MPLNATDFPPFVEAHKATDFPSFMEALDTLPYQVSHAILDSCLAQTSMAAGSGEATIRQRHQDEDRDEHHHRHRRKRSCKEIEAELGPMRRGAGELGQRLTLGVRGDD